MKGDITALKVTIIRNEHSDCARGGEGCGVCSSLKSDYKITEETDPEREKDTSKLLKTGAKKVYWLRVRENAVLPAMEKLLNEKDLSGPVICESNSLMKYIKPSLFLLLEASGEAMKKKSALDVEDKADLIIETTAESSNFDVSRLNFSDSRWSIQS